MTPTYLLCLCTTPPVARDYEAEKERYWARIVAHYILDDIVPGAEILFDEPLRGSWGRLPSGALYTASARMRAADDATAIVHSTVFAAEAPAPAAGKSRRVKSRLFEAETVVESVKLALQWIGEVDAAFRQIMADRNAERARRHAIMAAQRRELANYPHVVPPPADRDDFAASAAALAEDA